MATKQLDEEAIFNAARRIPTADQRALFLEQACGENAALAERVRALLEIYERDRTSLHSEEQPPDATRQFSSIAERPGSRIGPYRLMEQIGEGGFGQVFVAEQQEPVRRKVALKVIKPGMDSAQVIARFEAERQALALMDHPNIARVFDAGATESGRPFFVMELVRGIPITDYCDQHQLTPRERLELFVTVCQAIQHAHQKGIIHRDIKPSNVLVAAYDGKPMAKVIDFGVAKAMGQKLTERTLYTGFGGIVGTLEYMSPEQAEFNALDVDTRSDLYSLGVLLYELLTGTTPLTKERLQTAAITELLRVIREEEPPRPSTRLSESQDSLASISAQRRMEPGRLPKLVRGELDWIVMKALEKDRSRRYETANGLARDIGRYLADESVEACPPTLGYRVRKFARKHKTSLATAVVFLLLITAGTAVSVWQAVRATHAERVARKNEERANDEAAKALASAKRADEKAVEATVNERLARDAKLQSDRRLYGAHMNLAQLAWDENHLVRTLDLLKQHEPQPGEADVRGWEWHYLWRICHGDERTLTGHTTSVADVAFSPDGKWLASAGDYGDSTIKLWDVATGLFVRTLEGHTGGVYGLAFSRDGRRLASAGAYMDHTVRVWDPATGEVLHTLQGHGDRVQQVAFSPDGRQLVSAGLDRTVRVWDLARGTTALTFKSHVDSVKSVAFSPDGKHVASGDVRTVHVWNASTGDLLRTIKGDGINALTYSPDGRLIATADYDSVRLWNAETGDAVRTLGVPWGNRGAPGIQRPAFSPDGARLAAGCSDSTVRVWDVKSGTLLRTYRGHTSGVHAVAFNADGRRVASAGNDQAVKVWDVTTRAEMRRFKTIVGPCDALAFGPAGNELAAVGPQNSLRIWDTFGWRESRTWQGHGSAIHSIAYSRDGRRIASASGNWGQPGDVIVWDAATGQSLRQLTGFKNLVAGVSFHPDGGQLATASWDGTVKIWDLETGQVETNLDRGLGPWMTSVAYSPDGTRLAAAGHNGSVVVWDTQQRKLHHLGGPGNQNTVAFSPDGRRLASGSWNGTILLWDGGTLKLLHQLKGHADQVMSVAFSPDGRRLASGSSDSSIRLWDVVTGQQFLVLRGEQSGISVLSLAFSPDGWRLAASDNFGRVTVWDARSPTAEVRAEVAAVNLVQHAFARPLAKADVVATIRRDATIGEDIRKIALELAERSHEENDPQK